MKQFRSAIILALIAILGISLFDKLKYPDSFWIYGLAIGLGIAVTYYIISKKKKEAIGLFLTFSIMLYAGLEDLFFYLTSGGIPAEMPHLFNHKLIGGVARFIGETTVTPSILLISIGLGLLSSYLILNYLKVWRSFK